MNDNNTYEFNGEIKLEKVSHIDTNINNSKQSVLTFDVNMRVDNHTRNAVLALARDTVDKRTASEMVSILVENFLDNMTPSKLKIYQDFLDVLEQKIK